MSKISPLIAKYLYENKTISLDGFGVFSVDGNTTYDELSERNGTIPVNFVYNSSAKTELKFIDFIIAETGKIRPLAIADLDTYLNLSNQLLNISKPLVIDNVGTLNKISNGKLEFISGNFSHPKISTDNDRDKRMREAKETNNEKAVSFQNNYLNTNPKNKDLLKKILGATTLFLLLGGIGFAIYKFLPSNLMSSTDTSKNIKTPLVKKENNPKDTVNQTLATNTAKIPTADSLGKVDYKMVIDISNKADAQTRYNKLVSYSYKPLMYTTDNVNYKIAIPVHILPQDTLRVKDSLRSLFIVPAQIRAGKNVIVE